MSVLFNCLYVFEYVVVSIRSNTICEASRGNKTPEISDRAVIEPFR